MTAWIDCVTQVLHAYPELAILLGVVLTLVGLVVSVLVARLLCALWRA